MIQLIIALPQIEDARGIRSILLKNGFNVTGVCTTGAQVLSQIDGLNEGIIVCGYKMNDMMYSELRDCLPPGFDMLLMASRRALQECPDNNIVCLSMPFKVHDLIDTVSMMSSAMIRRRRKNRGKPKVRGAGEEALIKEAKELLMARNNMSEEEAYRYLQKCSMDSSTNMVETAQMVLAMFH